MGKNFKWKLFLKMNIYFCLLLTSATDKVKGKE